jgi:hypothetical protein
VQIVVAPAGRGRVEFRIIDTGIGISPQDRATVFDPYTQTAEGAEQHYGGTGLGLSISQRLVERMGGEIGVDSEPGGRIGVLLPGAAETGRAGRAAGRRRACRARRSIWRFPPAPRPSAGPPAFGPRRRGQPRRRSPGLARLLARAAPVEGEIPDVIVDTRFGPVLEKWLRKNPDAAGRFHVWLLVQPEERRALKHLLARPMTGWLLKPLRRATCCAISPTARNC